MHTLGDIRQISKALPPSRTSYENPLSFTEPTKMLLVMPMRCEKKVNHIHNITKDTIDHDDISMICFRLLQGGQGKNRTAKESALFSVLTIGFMASTMVTGPVFSQLLGTAIMGGQVLPNLMNRHRYDNIQNACENYLKEHGFQDLLEEIKTLKYPSDINKLDGILQKHNIPVSREFIYKVLQPR